MKNCAWCSNEFQSAVSYQIYCSTECRENATKEKIVDRYNLARAKKRIGKERRCAGGCGTLLSIYNNNGFCNICMVNKRKVDKILKELKGLFDYEQK
ncbi:MAG: hypothetical protein RL348_1233 [Bacteroidota bacterium]|jgi:hypothetical protein